jgi:hypothetical protein
MTPTTAMRRARPSHPSAPEDHQPRIPARAAGQVRAVVIERRAHLDAEAAAGIEDGADELFAARNPGTAGTKRALRQVLDRAAARAGVTLPEGFVQNRRGRVGSARSAARVPLSAHWRSSRHTTSGATAAAPSNNDSRSWTSQ